MRRSAFVVVLVFLIFFVISLITNIMGALIPNIRDDFHLSLGLAGFLPFSFFVGAWRQLRPTFLPPGGPSSIALTRASVPLTGPGLGPPPLTVAQAGPLPCAVVRRAVPTFETGERRLSTVLDGLDTARIELEEQLLANVNTQADLDSLAP